MACYSWKKNLQAKEYQHAGVKVFLFVKIADLSCLDFYVPRAFLPGQGSIWIAQEPYSIWEDYYCSTLFFFIISNRSREKGEGEKD